MKAFSRAVLFVPLLYTSSSLFAAPDNFDPCVCIDQMEQQTQRLLAHVRMSENAPDNYGYNSYVDRQNLPAIDSRQYAAFKINQYLPENLHDLTEGLVTADYATATQKVAEAAMIMYGLYSAMNGCPGKLP